MKLQKKRVNLSKPFTKAEWKYALSIEHKRNTFVYNDTEGELFPREQSLKAGEVVGRIENHSIGILC